MRLMSSEEMAGYKKITVQSPSQFVYHIQLNRPDKMNAINTQMWGELGEVFTKLGDDEDCRAIVLSANGRMFTSGIDLQDLMNVGAVVQDTDLDVARKAKKLYAKIRWYQDMFSCLETCPKPVIAAIHNACVGGGVDLITAADIRVCSEDAWFQVKEVDVGLAADVGTLQRLPKVIGSQSLVRELCLTARKLKSAEAEKIGLVSKVLPDQESTINEALALAQNIASKSPVAVQGTKVNLNYSRDHSVQDGLEYIATYNSQMLQSEDVLKSAMAMMAKEKAEFSKL